MFVHIAFKNGANSYLENCKSVEEVEKIVKKWSENYVLKERKCTMPGKGYFFEATEKKSILKQSPIGKGSEMLDKAKNGKKFIWEK